MLAIVCILLIPASLLMGKAALKILYGAEKRDLLFWEDEMLTGVILLIGLAEAAHLKEMALGRSVSASTDFFLLLTAGMLLVSSGILLTDYLRSRGGADKKRVKWRERIRFLLLSARPESFELPVLICLGVLAAIQIGIVATGAFLYLDADMTLETVEGFLKTDRIYESNPMTGLPYQQGIPSRLKILCLPTFYAMLCRLSHAGAELLVRHAVPAAVLLMAYLAYGILAKSLFPENRCHREIFLTLTLFLFFAGDYLYGMEGFGLLHGGFQGVNIRGAVLIPYLLSLCLRRKWRLALGPVLAEACIVWTLYGLGMGVFLLTVMAAPHAAGRIRGRRKEAPKCKNS